MRAAEPHPFAHTAREDADTEDQKSHAADQTAKRLAPVHRFDVDIERVAALLL